jgi:signal transduction histidine kinase
MSGPADAEPETTRRRLSLPAGLSARLLLLAALFAVAAELLILIPSLAAYQEGRLYDRVRAAELASLAVEAAPNRAVSDRMSAQLLNGAGVVSVAVQSSGVRRLLLAAPRMKRAPNLVDLRSRNPFAYLAQPFATLASPDEAFVRVVARPRFRDGDFVEIVVPDAPLKREVGAYLLRSLVMTVLIAIMAAGLLYLALNVFLVRPIKRLTRSMERFRADPADPAASLEPSGRDDEIGRAEAELDRMQADLRTALASRARLAALGEAVAKINHDLRNMLSSAQIASERLAMSGDPRVAQALPRLERALDRAIRLTSEVLAYGKSSEPAPQPQATALRPAVEAAGEDAGLSEVGVRLTCAVADDACALVDPEQLNRILVNLMKNAREAIADQAGKRPGEVKVTADRKAGQLVLKIADNGPGLPERARAHLFEPFTGSGRAGGTGLGLAVSRELAQANGGDLVLARSGPKGAVFELRLPAA